MNSKFSIEGYKDSSPDKNSSSLLIPGNLITMKGVSRALTLVPIVGGKPQYDRQVVANPGDDDIQFESDVESVLELPYAQYQNPVVGGNIQNYGTPGIDSSLEGFHYTPQIKVPLYEDQNGNMPLYGTEEYLQPLRGGINDVRIENPSISNILQNSGTDTDSNMRQSNEARLITEKRKQETPFVGAINPYGGWNLNSATTMLGASIQQGNTLGIIGSAGKLLLEGTRNGLAGAAAMKRYREDKAAYEQNLEDAERRQGLRWTMQKGGKLGKILTGNFIEGNDNHSMPNVEVEAKEMLQTPDGSVMEVMGKRHSKGGELLNVPEGTKVISDYLKIGSKLATFFKKEYDLNVKAGSTFATVLSQYRKKIGLTELLEKESDFMEKILDQEDIKFEGSREINLQVLSGKVQELQPQKEQLESMFENFTNLVFEKQEQSKQPEGPNFEKQTGGEVVDETVVSEDGQPIPQQSGQQDSSEIEQLIIAYSQLTGQDPAQIVEQLQQMPEEQIQQALEQMAQEIQQSQSQQQPVESFQPGGQYKKTLREFNDYMSNYSWNPNYEYGNLQEQAQAIVPFLERNGISYNPDDLKTQVGMDKLAGLAQQSFRTNYTPISDHYSSLVAPTQRGLQTALNNGLITEKELQNLGVKVSKGTVLRGSKGIIPDGNEQKVLNTITKNGEKNKEGYKKYVDTNFVDNKWYFRNPNIQTVTFDTQKELDDYTKNFKTSFDSNGEKIYYSDKQGLYFKPEVLNRNESFSQTDNTSNPVEQTNVQNNDIKPIGNRRAQDFNSNLPLLVPDQSNLPPNLLQPGLRQVGSVQANAIRVSPEETIRELNRQYTTASDLSSQTNPYTSGAMQANLQAQTNSAINQAYSQAAVVNAQDQRNVENLNEERIRQRDITNLGMLDQYEQRSQTALENYANEWKSYIDKRNLENVANWNLENQRQAFNAVNPNYQIGSMGWYQTNESPVFYVNGKPFMTDPTTGNTYEVVTKTDNKGNSTVTQKQGTYQNTRMTRKPNKQKKGGLLLSQNIKNLLK